MHRVRDILGKNGLLVDEEMFPVRLVDKVRMQKLHNNGDNTVGLFEWRKVNGRRQVIAVDILWGMPRHKFEGTLAHELGHAWLFLNHVDRLDDKLTEGLCNLLAYAIHREAFAPESLFELQRLFRNPDPAYGTEFRRAEKLLVKFSVGALMRYVAKYQALPSC
jgi:hypothetical protein